MRDREYLQEMAYIEAEKREMEEEELRKLELADLKPAKIIIVDEKGREFDKIRVDALPFSRDNKERV